MLRYITLNQYCSFLFVFTPVWYSSPLFKLWSDIIIMLLFWWFRTCCLRPLSCFQNCPCQKLISYVYMLAIFTRFSFWISLFEPCKTYPSYVFCKSFHSGNGCDLFAIFVFKFIIISVFEPEQHSQWTWNAWIGKYEAAFSLA